MEKKIQKLISDIIRKDKRAIARAISMVESETPESIDLLNRLHNYKNNALRVGITGPPGAGKSTFTNQLIKMIRNKGKSVGVIAVDPSSPFSGGAILGDRIRMKDVMLDKDVFIRSMASRGNLGGLARQSVNAAEILEAAGSDIIIFETVGVGQVEMDVMSAVDTVVLMTVPDAGDVIQTMKAGIMEIGDIFVVNKADLSGAKRMFDDIEYMLSLRPKIENWLPPIHLTKALNGDGIADVLEDIFRHFNYLDESGQLLEKRRQRIKDKIKSLVNDRIIRNYWDDETLKFLDDYIENEIKNISPYQIAEELLKE
jgi:LAO/AO transport system kinase